MSPRTGWWNLGWSLIIAVFGIMIVPIGAAIGDPGLVIDDLEFFLPFVILPLALGIGLCVWSRRFPHEP